MYLAMLMTWVTLLRSNILYELNNKNCMMIIRQ